jgi:cytochrome P450
MTPLEEFRAAEAISPSQANRILFTLLSDDVSRAELYQCLSGSGGVLKFQSRADTKQGSPQNIPSEFHQEVYLLAAEGPIQTALTDTKKFSNSPYSALGSGTFMLGLDGADHRDQRNFAKAYLEFDPQVIEALASIAFNAGAVLPLKQRDFDVADVAEQAALRFAGFLFGFAQADHVLLEAAMRAAYRALSYQIVGRHFVTEPSAVLNADIGMGALLQRVAYLIDLYRRRNGREQEDEYGRIEDELKELRDLLNPNGEKPPREFVPVLRRLAGPLLDDVKKDYSGTELAVIVVGLIAGTVGNIQAGVCIALDRFFRDPGRFEPARETAQKAWGGDRAAAGMLEEFIWEALRLNPPAAFLPRKTLKEILLGGERIPEKSVVILGMGAATRARNADALIFGGSSDEDGYVHQCIGRHLAMPVIVRVVRQILLLPGLARRLDPRNGEALCLEKLWGIICLRFPLEFDRESILTQSPLIVIMSVKTPVSVHAEALKAIIKYGAPRIEKKLRDAKHVHFAWFKLIENDTKLMLSTVYDRDFDAYIEYFALEIGPLFDLLFQHIEDAPPMPVNEFPKEFVDTIRRYNTRPVSGYFFSAYPNADVSMITQQFPPEDA